MFDAYVVLRTTDRELFRAK